MLARLIPIWITYFLVAASPGPSQVFVVENASLGTKERGQWAALGISLGTAVWVALVALGLNQIVHAFASGPFVLKVGSALLLAYFILRNILQLLQTKKSAANAAPKLKDETPRATFVKGLLVNLVNPNSVIFFLSLFAPLLVTAKTPLELGTCALGVIVISLIWYQTLGVISSHRHTRRLLARSETGTRVLFLLFYCWFFVKILRSF